MKKNKPLMWMIAILVFIVSAALVQGTLNNISYLYLPVVYLEPSKTPTPSPTPSITPSPTATPDYDVSIVDIVNSNTMDPLNEYVSIKNHRSKSVDLTDWFIRDDGPNRYDFPENFIIGSKKTIKIWTKDGVDSATNLYWGSPVEVWNDSGDCAYLRDDSEGKKTLVDTYCYTKEEDGLMIILRTP
jgi:hypothetical protein